MDGLAPFNYRKLPYVGPFGRRGQYRQQYREFPSETSLFSACQYRKVPARSRRTVRKVEPLGVGLFDRAHCLVARLPDADMKRTRKVGDLQQARALPMSAADTPRRHLRTGAELDEPTA